MKVNELSCSQVTDTSCEGDPEADCFQVSILSQIFLFFVADKCIKINLIVKKWNPMWSSTASEWLFYTFFKKTNKYDWLTHKILGIQQPFMIIWHPK